MDFRVMEMIGETEPIATGHGIRNLARLNKVYGHAKWRKVKGVAKVRLSDGAMCLAEVHWYEGHGIGRKEMKIKRYL